MRPERILIAPTVYSVVLDLPRNQACSGSMDGTVRVWDLQKGECRHTLTGHTSLVGLLGLSPSHLVSAAADSTLRIWDPDSGELRHTLAAHTGAITCFQHDEFKVLSGSDGNLKMWNIRDGTVVRDLLTGITGVWQVVFEGRWCVAASNRQDTTVLDVWDFGTEDDDDWVGEPPNGVYDDEEFSDEEEEEDEQAAKIKRLMDMRRVEEDEQEQADVDAMDEDLVPSESESLELIEVEGSQEEDSPIGDMAKRRALTRQRHSRQSIDVDIDLDDDTRGPADSDTDSTMPQEGVGASRWASSTSGNVRTASSSALPSRTTSRSSRSLAVAGPSRRAGNLVGSSSLPPIMSDETPTRPRIRPANNRRQR